MMRIVPDKDMEVLREYLSEPMVFLVPESFVNANLPSDEAHALRDAEGFIDFATDDAEVWVDIVEDKGHALITELLGLG